METKQIIYQGKPVWFTVLGKRRNFVASIQKDKVLQPNVQSRLDANHWMLFLDFDRLPEGFETFEGLDEYLRRLPLFVFKSYSGKPKAVLLVESSSMSHNKAMDTLRSVVGELVDSIDGQGIFHSFVRATYFDELSEYLKVAPTCAISDSSYWRLREVPELREATENENKVLRFAASSEKFGPVALPQKFVAEEMGLTLLQVNRAIKSLVEKKLLECVNHSFTPGRQAKNYEVRATALVVLRALTPSLQGIVISVAPSIIPDGEWFKTVWACTNLFKDTASFTTWLTGVWGVQLKGRLKRGMSAWMAHAKREWLVWV